MDNWFAYSEIVLSACLQNDRDTAAQVLVVNQITEDDFPPGEIYADIFKGINAVLNQRDFKPSPINVWYYSGRADDERLLDEIKRIAAQGHSVDTALETVRMLIDEAEHHKVKTLIEEGLAEFDRGADAKQIARETLRQLHRLNDRVVLTVSASEIMDHIEVGHVGRGPIISTGFDWFDKALKGGLQAKKLIALSGDAGFGNSTWLYNILANVFAEPREDLTVAYLSFQLQRHTIAADLYTMFAMKHLLQSGPEVCNQQWDGLPYHEWLQYERLMLALHTGAIQDFPEPLQEAVQQGLNDVRSRSISIYDSEYDGGNLVTLDDLERVVHTHYVRHQRPDQLFLVVIDYLDQVKGSNDNRHEKAVRRLTQIIADKNACIISLVQDGEEACKYLTPVAHHNIDVRNMDNQFIDLTVRQSKHSRISPNETYTYHTHVESGLIITDEVADSLVSSPAF